MVQKPRNPFRFFSYLVVAGLFFAGASVAFALPAVLHLLPPLSASRSEPVPEIQVRAFDFQNAVNEEPASGLRGQLARLAASHRAFSRSA